MLGQKIYQFPSLFNPFTHDFFTKMSLNFITNKPYSVSHAGAYLPVYASHSSVFCTAPLPERKKEQLANFFFLTRSPLARYKLIHTFTPIHKEKKSASLSCLAEGNVAVASGTTTVHHFRMCIFTSTESKKGGDHARKAFPSLLVRPHSSTAKGLGFGTRQ